MGAFALLLVAYVAFAAWTGVRSWRLTRRWASPWPRRLLTSAVLALFLAPSLIPAGHGVAVGPAWLGASAWDTRGDVLKFVAAPIALGALGAFLLWSLGAALRGAAVATLAPAAPPGRGEIAVTVSCLLVVPALATAAAITQRHGERVRQAARADQMLQDQRAAMDRATVGTWRQERHGAGLRWTLRVPGGRLTGHPQVLPRVPESGEVAVVGDPGSFAPGTLISIAADGGGRGGSGTVDDGGGFEIVLEARRDAYLSLRPIRIAAAPASQRQAILRAQPVPTPAPEGAGDAISTPAP